VFWATEGCDQLLLASLKLNDGGDLMAAAKIVRSEPQRQAASARSPLEWTVLMTHLRLCAVLAYLGDHATYRASCADQLALGGGTTDPYVAERVAKACMILPDSGVEVAVLRPLIRVTQVGASNPDFERWSLLLTLLANYRASDFSGAIDAGSRLAEHPRALQEVKAMGAAVLAMAEKRGGHPVAAAAALKAARGLMVDHWQAQADKLYWWDWMMTSVLIREAEQLIATESPPTK
jgi:eukaryotic-like serine/threonine-protein kinase